MAMDRRGFLPGLAERSLIPGLFGVKEGSNPSAEYVVRVYSLFMENCRGDIQNAGKSQPIPTFSLSIMTGLCREALKTLSMSKPLVRTGRETTVVSDLNGNLINLLTFFINQGLPPLQSYVFLGNIINFGEFSLETLTFLLALMVCQPNDLIILRGSNEDNPVCVLKGLRDEITSVYGSQSLWPMCLEIFSMLPYAALYGETVLCTAPYVINRYQTIEEIESVHLPSIPPSIESGDSFISYSKSPTSVDDKEGVEFLERNQLSYLICGDYQGNSCSDMGCDGRMLSFTSSLSCTDNLLVVLSGINKVSPFIVDTGDLVYRSEATFADAEIYAQPKKPFIHLASTKQSFTPKAKLAIPSVSSHGNIVGKRSAFRLSPLPEHAVTHSTSQHLTSIPSVTEDKDCIFCS